MYLSGEESSLNIVTTAPAWDKKKLVWLNQLCSGFELWSLIPFLIMIVVYWPLTRPNMPFQRKEVTHSDSSYEKKSRRRAWLTMWDKVKSHGALIDWCTGRKWPLNCMSYFHLMMIKHACPKTPEVAYSDLASHENKYWVGNWTII